MKPDLPILSGKEARQFIALVKEQYGSVPNFFDDVVFARRKDRIVILNRDIEGIIGASLRINSMGLYIAEVKDSQLRLSIEGAQLIGPVASRNIYEIDDGKMRQWFKGEDISCDLSFSGFVILKWNDDFIGSGRYKEGFILNFVPKARRLIDVH